MRWRTANGALELGGRTLLMGVVNVTPDSFSDGGLFLDPEAGVRQGIRLAADGADLLDVGGGAAPPRSGAGPPGGGSDPGGPPLKRLAAPGAGPVPLHPREGGGAAGPPRP